MAALRICLLFVLLVTEDAYAIKGSTISHPGQFPYQTHLIVNFLNSDTLHRTGSLISKKYLLTTASNVHRSTTITIILGVYNVEVKDDLSRRTYDGIYYKVHEKYIIDTGANNIALVKMNQNAEITDFIRMIPLPRFSKICHSLIDEKARISGWGAVTPETPVGHQVLRYSDILIRPYHLCKNNFPETNYKELCATHPWRYFEESDIGAPLVLRNALVGIASQTSWKNAVESSPQTYIRVDAYLEWIEINSDVIILEK